MDQEDNEKTTLDQSKKSLKKIPKNEHAQKFKVLLLDENELQKIDNIDSYLHLEKLSISRNQLLRMYGVCRLHNLRELNLSFNGILTIEGLKELVHLTHLNLEGNNIKTIEHLNTNIKLEYLNLSENSIGCISDISFLKCLKELHLSGNRITHLRQCEKYLPSCLEVLLLSKNNIADLNEICSLCNLCNLHTISINDNSCVQMTGKSDGFDHRPFVLNWCMSVKVIDGFAVDPIESLKAEWLYSQGRGRQFRVGDQIALSKYLSSVCPLLGKALENENERKLRLILSKAQQHQRQLQEEISENSNTSGRNSPSTGKKLSSSRIQSPRFHRFGGRQGSPDSMSNSYHGSMSIGSIVSSDTLSNNNNLLQMTTSLIENIKNDSLMTQSFDETISSCRNVKGSPNLSQDLTSKKVTSSQDSEQQQNILVSGPLTAASKMVPVPETLMSPDCCPISLTSISCQNQIDYKNSSPKATYSSNLKRNHEAPSFSSPKKSNFNSTQKSCKVDNKLSKSFSSTTNCIEINSGGGSATMSSDDDSDHINVDKLKTIKNKVAQRNQQQKENLKSVNINNETVSSAIMIQKVWRGYQIRKKNKHEIEKLLKKRIQEYIEKLAKDMEMTKTQLENERKIQQLQMQAINALWKKVSSMQTAIQTNQDLSKTDDNNCSQVNSLDNSTTAVVNDLAKTCSILTNQVEQLQNSMRDILNCMTVFCNLPHENMKKSSTSCDEKKDSVTTQTEISAVHTPQLENHLNFPFKIRPCSLPLDNVGDEVVQDVSNENLPEAEDTTTKLTLENVDNIQS